MLIDIPDGMPLAMTTFFFFFFFLHFPRYVYILLHWAHTGIAHPKTYTRCKEGTESSKSSFFCLFTIDALSCLSRYLQVQHCIQHGCQCHRIRPIQIHVHASHVSKILRLPLERTHIQRHKRKDMYIILICTSAFQRCLV